LRPYAYCSSNFEIGSSLATAAIVGALALGSAVANAEDSRGARSITVKFADLKVSTPEGAAALYGRLRGRQ
jgi:UrcA family protein